MSEYIRLAFARCSCSCQAGSSPHALGRSSTATTFVWAMMAIFVAWAVVFVVPLQRI
jgi:hypothetical protein